MSNRQQRRHPQHTSLPTIYPAKKRIITKEKKNSYITKKGTKQRGKQKII